MSQKVGNIFDLRSGNYNFDQMEKRIQEYKFSESEICVKDIRDMNVNYMVAFLRSKIKDFKNLLWLKVERNDYHNHFPIISDQIEKCSLYVPREFDHYIISKLEIFQLKNTLNYDSESKLFLEIEDPVTGVKLDFSRTDYFNIKNDSEIKQSHSISYKYYKLEDKFLRYSKNYYELLKKPEENMGYDFCLLHAKRELLEILQRY